MIETPPLTPLEQNAHKWVLLCQRYRVDPLTATALDFEQKPEQPQIRRIEVTVSVDTAELKDWAQRHLTTGHHGVAAILFEAADQLENQTGEK